MENTSYQEGEGGSVLPQHEAPSTKEEEEEEEEEDKSQERSQVDVTIPQESQGEKSQDDVTKSQENQEERIGTTLSEAAAKVTAEEEANEEEGSDERTKAALCESSKIVSGEARKENTASKLKESAHSVLSSTTEDLLKEIAQENHENHSPDEVENHAQDDEDIERSQGGEKDQQGQEQESTTGNRMTKGKKGSDWVLWEKLYGAKNGKKAIEKTKRRLSSSSSQRRLCSPSSKSLSTSQNGSRNKPSKEMVRSKSKRVYSKDDDAKHCTFSPKISAGSRNMVRSSGPFLQRIDNAFEAKMSALELRKAKEDYEARVDKKSCPSCLAEQSYDEFKSRKNKCRSCNVPFRYRVVWQDVGETFLSRMESKLQEREEKLADIESKTAPPFRLEEKEAFDPEYGRSRKVKIRQQPWEYVEASFMQRMEIDSKRREMKQLLSEENAMLSSECTFSPRVNTSRSMYGGWSQSSFLEDTFEERTERDTARRLREKAANELRARYREPVSPSVPLATKTRAAWDESRTFMSTDVSARSCGWR